ncbi:hypothetical protein BS47DRAFT_283757 [Hydnum rufescens UP504]|uniref:Uncharacterized protein n=1 Tax=Hydnum rufescens UP504 TaxID=1448309 RepID=A0A9P6ALP7_9AGAM|nr:hypothetical protein BS47DRAFT_283757 [Hydnum rufescens UP504]
MREDTVSRSSCFSSSTQEDAHDPCPRCLEFTLRTLKILHSLTPSSLSDHTGYGGVSSANLRDSRHSAHSADSWAGAAISRMSSHVRLTDAHSASELQCMLQYAFGRCCPVLASNSCWHPRRGEEVRCCQCFSPDPRLMKAGE